MKPQLTIAHEGTLGDEDRTRFKFHEESIAHIMRVLTDLYENPELAVIREYSTNARDAMIAAGKADKPILITLPDEMMDATFIVRDEGLGLSRAEIVENLTQYGYSSKRDNDDETGMLGLGSKSALTYTSQFSYVACKDGVTCTVLITREDDGAPVLQVVDEFDSPDQPNFVEVHVPVKNVSSFNMTAQKFFWTWEKGTVDFTNRAAHSTIFEDEGDHLWLSDDVVLINRQRGYGYSTNVTIVQGGVSYRVGLEQMDSEVMEALRGWHLYAFIDVGTVDFTPSRETLMVTKRTKEALEELSQYVHARLFPALNVLLHEMTFNDALMWIRDRQELARWMFKKGTTLKWNGRLLSFKYSVDLPDRLLPAWTISSNPDTWSRVDRADSALSLQLSHPPCAVVYGHNLGASVSGDVKEQIRAAIQKHDPDILSPKAATNGYTRRANPILIVKAIPSPDLLEMIGDPPLFLFSDVYKKEKVERRSSRALETRFRMADSGSFSGWKTVHELDYRPQAWVAADDFRTGEKQERIHAVTKAGHRVAVVWKRNAKWFAENHPHALEITEYLKNYAEVEVPKIKASMGDIARHRMHQCHRDDCKHLGTWARTLGDLCLQVEDSDLHDVMRIVRASTQPSLTVDQMLATVGPARLFGIAIDTTVTSDYCAKAATVYRRYPILAWIHMHNFRYSDGKDELVRIINAAYGPKDPSTELVLWDHPSNPNRIKAFSACNHRLIQPTIKTLEGVML